MEELLKRIVNLGIGAAKGLEDNLQTAFKAAEQGINELISKGDSSGETGSTQVKKFVNRATAEARVIAILEAEREAAKAASEAEAASEASSEATVVAPMPELSEGQQDDVAVSRIVARWMVLSEDNKASLLALLIPAKPAAAKPAA